MERRGEKDANPFGSLSFFFFLFTFVKQSQKGERMEGKEGRERERDREGLVYCTNKLME